jgi:hypothetical protein
VPSAASKDQQVADVCFGEYFRPSSWHILYRS